MGICYSLVKKTMTAFQQSYTFLGIVNVPVFCIMSRHTYILLWKKKIKSPLLYRMGFTSKLLNLLQSKIRLNTSKAFQLDLVLICKDTYQTLLLHLVLKAVTEKKGMISHNTIILSLVLVLIFL